MVAFTNVLAAAGLIATALAKDWSALCREYPPSKGECVIISHYSQRQLNAGDRKIMRLSGECEVREDADWVPQSPGFKYEFDIGGIGHVVARTSSVGGDAVARPSVTVNGKTPPSFDRGQKSFSEGITVTWYRQLNYKCLDL